MTTRRTRGTDRAATILLGLVLIALAAARLGVAARPDRTARPAGPRSPGVGLRRREQLVALGRRRGRRCCSASSDCSGCWPTCHARPAAAPGSPASDATGRLEADHASLAKALAERWAPSPRSPATRGRTSPDAPDVVVLSGHVELEADVADILDAADQVEREVAEAFPDLDVRVRFLLEGPSRQPRTRRSTEIAVQ